MNHGWQTDPYKIRRNIDDFARASIRTPRYRRPWNASPPWRARLRVTLKPSDSSARQTRCAAAWDSSGFQVYDDAYNTSVAAVRNTLTDNEFESTWAEGAAMSASEVIAYAQRGRGERKRPSNGWASLTPTELDVVRLVSEGLANKDIATRLFISPRTVATHLTHVYTKLGLTSRVQLAQEAARRADTSAAAMVGAGGIEAPGTAERNSPGKAAIGEWSLLDNDGDDGRRRTCGNSHHVDAVKFRGNDRRPDFTIRTSAN